MLNPSSKRKRYLWLFRVLQVTANIAIIVVAALLIFSFVKYKPWKDQVTERVEVPRRPPQPVGAKGQRITLGKVDWAANKRTMVIALNTDCRFCTESASFYKRLVQMKSRGDTTVRLVAAFSQPVDVASTYLASLGVDIRDIEESSLDSLFIRGTPTILLVDDTGLVTDVWIGRLDSRRESEVIGRIRSST